jgi:hypothetical protein
VLLLAAAAVVGTYGMATQHLTDTCTIADAGGSVTVPGSCVEAARAR